MALDTKKLARGGMTVLLAASMASQALPVAAFAEEAGAAAAVTAGLGNVPAAATSAWQVGHTYSVPMTVWMNNVVQAPEMMLKYYNSDVVVTPLANGTYDVAFTITQPDKITAASQDGVAVEPELVDGKAVYHFTATTMDADAMANPGVEVYLTIPAMGNSFQMNLRLDVASATDTTPVPSVDKTELEAAIASAQATSQGNKTDAAWQELQTAIAEAQKVAGQTDADQEAVDAAAAKLNAAVEAFNKSDEVQDAYDSSFKLYYKGEDATERFGRSFNDQVKVVPQADGTYVVELTAKSLGANATLGDVTVDGKAVSFEDDADGNRTYSLPFASVEGKLDFTFSYTISGAGITNSHDFQLELTDAESEVELEVGKTYRIAKEFQKEDGTASMSDSYFDENAVVTVNEDGTYTVYLVANDTDAAGVSGLAVGGTEAEVFSQEGTKTTFKFEVATLDEATEVLLHAVIKPSTTHDATAYLAFDLSTATETQAPAKPEEKPEQVDKGELTAAIEDARAIEQGNKTDEAYEALQEALVAAQAVAASDSATQDDVDAAVSALKTAVSTFRASADKPAEEQVEGLEEGKTYSVPMTVLKATSDDTSMASQYFGTKAKVTFADGLYTVTFSTNLTSEQKGWITDLALANGGKIDTAEDGNNLVATFTTESLDDPIAFSMTVVPMANQTVEARLSFDLANATEVADEDGGDFNYGGGGSNSGTTNGGTVNGVTATKPNSTLTGTTKPTSSLPQTGDSSLIATVATALGGIGLVGAAEVLRRRVRASKEA